MDALHVVRDVAIIILAVESIVIGAATLFLVLQVWRLVGLTRRYLDTIGTSTTSILGTVQDTAKQAQGTASFVGDRTARPVIEMYGVFAGASRFARAVMASRRPVPSSEVDS